MASQGRTAKTPLPLEEMLLTRRDVGQGCSRDPQRSSICSRLMPSGPLGTTRPNHVATYTAHPPHLQGPGLPTLYQLP